MANPSPETKNPIKMMNHILLPSIPKSGHKWPQVQSKWIQGLRYQSGNGVILNTHVKKLVTDFKDEFCA